MASAEITADYVSQQLQYDKNTGVFRRNGLLAGCIDRSTGYRKISINGKQYYAHRLAWLLTHGEWPKKHIDHINGIKDDNRISNLRDQSVDVNTQNIRAPKKGNKTGFLGVCFATRERKFVATITVERKHIFVGYFDTAEEAHQAYLEEKRKLHSGCTI